LLDELSIARGEGAFRKVMDGYKKYELLIFDEWLLTALSLPECRDLLEVIEKRHFGCSTIFLSQLDVSFCKNIFTLYILQKALILLFHFQQNQITNLNFVKPYLF